MPEGLRESRSLHARALLVYHYIKKSTLQFPAKVAKNQRVEKSRAKFLGSAGNEPAACIPAERVGGREGLDEPATAAPEGAQSPEHAVAVVVLDEDVTSRPRKIADSLLMCECLKELARAGDGLRGATEAGDSAGLVVGERKVLLTTRELGEREVAWRDVALDCRQQVLLEVVAEVRNAHARTLGRIHDVRFRGDELFCAGRMKTSGKREERIATRDLEPSPSLIGVNEHELVGEKKINPVIPADFVQYRLKWAEGFWMLDFHRLLLPG